MRVDTFLNRIIGSAKSLRFRLYNLFGLTAGRVPGKDLPEAYRRFMPAQRTGHMLMKLNAKKVIAIALMINLMFLGMYFFIGPLSAAESKQTPKAGVKKETVVDPRVRLESLKQREELLRIRQRELQDLEKRIDEKIRRLTVLETNVKAEIAAYKQISDARVK
ncbi:hypothetical protein EG829_20030, partial [bacterium]|nr:hypothetical protein [bacterium]